MAKVRELFIIMGALAVLIAAVWFWLYLRPSNVRVEKLREEIKEREETIERDEREATQRNINFARMDAHLSEIQKEWDEKAAALPSTFDIPMVLRHIQSVIYPHTDAIEAEFNVSEQREGDLIFSTIVKLEFTTSYWQFLSILDNLVTRGNLGNRVVTYNFEVLPMPQGDFNDFLDRVESRSHELSDEIRGMLVRELSAARTEGHEVVGLYMLDVVMEVEYLTITAGIHSEDDLRAIWAAQEELLEALGQFNE